MRISARAEYAVQACAELARGGAGAPPLPTEVLAQQQGLPESFLAQILLTLRRAGIVASTRGKAGGYRLARPAHEVTIADVVRAVDGPLVTVRDERPTEVAYAGPSEPLAHVWVALRAAVRDVLEGVSIADLVSGTLPAEVQHLAAREDAWLSP